ncbi:HEAT repeat domain-containing protein [Terriglobus sp. RCC_193]|uniref:HEAT repeat domain-containing protein n=1 Tax=Terriglobus sp. RCC_193 TaxID=3239218 RepID=UPI0035255ABF
MKLTLRTACLFAACCTSPLMHAATFELPAAVSAEDDYARGTQALDQQRWQDAIASFDRVVETKGKKADAALYWKAYALNKLGRNELVSSTCAQLHTSFASSTWNKDCAALTVAGASSDGNVSSDHGPRHSSAGSDADLKALALNSLLNRDPAQALPLIRNILTGSNPVELKQRALTMLAQNASPDAQALVRDVAAGKIAPEEQKHAIRMMGVFQGKRADDTLAEIYRTSNDHAIKRTVISSLFIAGDAPRMVELARNEKDLSLKHDIVSQLALMQDKAATDYMMELLK